MGRINWREEFDRADQKSMKLYHELKLEQIRKLFIGLVLNCDNEKHLCSSLTFLAAKGNLRLVEGCNGPELVSREGGVCHEQ